eukprot:Clim_evm13s25 gene=Clim_evmTU13s25
MSLRTVHSAILRQRSGLVPLQKEIAFNAIRALSAQALSVVEGIVGKEHATAAESQRMFYGADEGLIDSSPPDLVVFPESTAEVSELVKLCAKDRIPVIPYGTGTGLEGGVCALKGGLCISTERMDKILEVWPEDMNMEVQAGVTRTAANHAVKDDGLMFTVDPGADASVGGLVSTGASGTNTVRYGTIKDNVCNLEVVLPSGEVMHTAGEGTRPRKTSAGYNLTELFIGAEGTLGLITSATLRLHGVPAYTAAAVCNFDTLEGCVDSVIAVMQCAIPVSRIEFLDEIEIGAVNEFSNMSFAEKPTLFLEFNGGDEQSVQSQADMVKDLVTDLGGSDFEWAVRQEERNRLWHARHNAWYAAKNMRKGESIRGWSTDVAVPISRLSQAVLETKADIKKYGITAPIVGHVGDGNFHCMMMLDVSNPDEIKAAEEFNGHLIERALRLGGTITGEHGVQLGKKKYLGKQFNEAAMNIKRSIKHAIDPHGIMNPGKIV